MIGRRSFAAALAWLLPMRHASEPKIVPALGTVIGFTTAQGRHWHWAGTFKIPAGEFVLVTEDGSGGTSWRVESDRSRDQGVSTQSPAPSLPVAVDAPASSVQRSAGPAGGGA